MKLLFYALFPTLFIYYIYLSVIVPLSRKKLLNKAIEDGHVIVAKKVKTINRTGTTEDHFTANLKYGVYKYEYNGKKYKLRTNSHREPPMEVKVYFRTKPSRAKLRDEFGALENMFWYIYFVIIIIFIIFGIGK